MSRQCLSLAVFAVFLLPIISAKDDACAATVPDFKAPGRRISEEKCREYNWQRKHLNNCSQEPANTEHPYMGAVGYLKANKTDYSFLCAAFLISPKFAVGVASCFTGPALVYNPQIVRFGNSNIKSDVSRVDAKILRTIVHPKYTSSYRNNDITLIEFENDVPLSKSILPGCLWSQASLEGIKYGNAPGWGSDKTGRKRDVLEVMKTKLLDKETCEPMVKGVFNSAWRQIEDTQICGDETESDVVMCKGSAGIPLITARKVDDDEMPYAFGLISFGPKVCPNWGIYSRVSSYVDWIEETVWPSKKTS